VYARLARLEAASVDLVLVQFSPELEAMEGFGETVIRPKTVASALA
jgi:hypothetical protein